MWNADLGKGKILSQAKTLQELLENISEYSATTYQEHGERLEDIEAIYFENEHGSRSTLSDKGFDEFMRKYDSLTQCIAENCQSENLHIRQVQSDYYSSLI